MSTSTVTPEIARFADGVRAALADLPSEEVDDLTEGLEADLAESLAEDLRRTLPDPVAYAAELRLAAGLPGRVPKRGALGGLAETWLNAREGVADAIGRNPALASAADFLTVLRPAWWIVRGWLAAWLAASFFGMESGYAVSGAWWLVLAASVIVSVQWGRGRWTFTGLRGLIVIGNVIAAVALLPVLEAANTGGGDSYYAEPAADVSQGLTMNGQPVENIYAYDSAGNPINGVQLFDVDGKPIDPFRDVDVTSLQQTPATLETGAEAYNVYPLAITKVIWDQHGDLVPDPNPDAGKAAAYANGPFLKVPAVQPPAASVPTTTPTVPAPPAKVAQPNE